MMAFELVVRNTSEVVTAQGSPSQSAEQALTPVPRGAIGIAQGRIAYLGDEASLPADAVRPTTMTVDARGGFVGPGFVDPHTHLVFAGERSAEFELRCRGATYLEIAQAGGGIMSTVRATRAASEDQLIEAALPRLARLCQQGVTTAEVKSGYGLNVADELKMLRAVKRLSGLQPVELLPTLLCGHAIPEEFLTSRADYVRLCVEEIIPAVAQERLAVFCDAFAEQGAFTADEARTLLEAAKRHGLVPRLHAEQLSASGGAELAAVVGAASADHLEHVDARGIQALAKAGVSAVLVPVSTLFLRQRPYAPGRALKDGGVNVALGTNVNPGSAMSENLGITLSLACLENGLTAAEAYWGMTRGAAIALRRPQAGRLRVGDPADCVVFSCRDYRHLPYHLAINHAAVVIKGGAVVSQRAGPVCS